MSDCTGCRNTQVLFMLTELLWDHTFLSDVTGCRKVQVSDVTGSTQVSDVTGCRKVQVSDCIGSTVYIIIVLHN